MKIVARRLVGHYLANAGNRNEGILRLQAQAFVEGDKSGDPQRIRLLETKFRQVIETGRANAVAAPASQSARVLTALHPIDPDWNRGLATVGLVLMLPAKADPRSYI